MHPIRKNPIWSQRYCFFFIYTSIFVKKYDFSAKFSFLLLFYCACARKRVNLQAETQKP